MEAFNDHNFYPLTIMLDRYQGSYSGGAWLAMNRNPDEVPGDIGGGDPDEDNFYRSDPEREYVGRGATPQEAVDDLKRRIDRLAENPS